MYYIGVDVGGTKLSAGVVNENCDILAKDKLPARPERGIDAVIDDILLLTKNVTAMAGVDTRDIALIGIGLPGAIDIEKGRLIYAGNLPYDNTPIVDILRKYWDIPVILGNDANAAALGEVLKGAARDHNDVLMLTLGTGIGGGIIINRKIYSGFNGLAGEVGHMIIEKDGKRCTCGRLGCFEAYASATGLKRLTRERMLQNRDSLMWRIAGSAETAGGRTAFDAAQQGDAEGARVVSEYIGYLACGVINLISIFQPEVVIIGGGVSKQGESLLAPLRKLVEEAAFTSKVAEAKIVPAILGNDAGIIGAAMLGK